VNNIQHILFEQNTILRFVTSCPLFPYLNLKFMKIMNLLLMRLEDTR